MTGALIALALVATVPILVRFGQLITEHIAGSGVLDRGFWDGCASLALMVTSLSLAAFLSIRERRAGRNAARTRPSSRLSLGELP
jgi:hypothetical protein